MPGARDPDTCLIPRSLGKKDIIYKKSQDIGNWHTSHVHPSTSASGMFLQYQIILRVRGWETRCII